MKILFLIIMRDVWKRKDESCPEKVEEESVQSWPCLVGGEIGGLYCVDEMTNWGRRYVWNGWFVGGILWLGYMFVDGCCGDLFLQVG